MEKNTLKTDILMQRPEQAAAVSDCVGDKAKGMARVRPVPPLRRAGYRFGLFFMDFRNLLGHQVNGVAPGRHPGSLFKENALRAAANIADGRIRHEKDIHADSFTDHFLL
jgi:hypothetical protein